MFPHTGTGIRPVGAPGPCLRGLPLFPADQVAPGQLLKALPADQLGSAALRAPSEPPLPAGRKREWPDGAVPFPKWACLALARGSWQGRVRV